MSVDLWAVGDWYPFGGDRARRVQALGANFYYLFFFLSREIFFFSLSLFWGEFSMDLLLVFSAVACADRRKEEEEEEEEERRTDAVEREKRER